MRVKHDSSRRRWWATVACGAAERRRKRGDGCARFGTRRGQPRWASIFRIANRIRDLLAHPGSLTETSSENLRRPGLRWRSRGAGPPRAQGRVPAFRIAQRALIAILAESAVDLHGGFGGDLVAQLLSDVTMPSCEARSRISLSIRPSKCAGEREDFRSSRLALVVTISPVTLPRCPKRRKRR